MVANQDLAALALLGPGRVLKVRSHRAPQWQRLIVERHAAAGRHGVRGRDDAVAQTPVDLGRALLGVLRAGRRRRAERRRREKDAARGLLLRVVGEQRRLGV
jgi:hypothetical protein